jgi:hypothetical protein
MEIFFFSVIQNFCFWAKFFQNVTQGGEKLIYREKKFRLIPYEIFSKCVIYMVAKNYFAVRKNFSTQWDQAKFSFKCGKKIFCATLFFGPLYSKEHNLLFILPHFFASYFQSKTFTSFLQIWHCIPLSPLI